MKFEFDSVKSRKNKEKHGIDFDEAQALWIAATVEVPLETDGEPRWAVVGKIESSFWTAVITYRGDSIRIISVRRSREEEKAIYER